MFTKKLPKTQSTSKLLKILTKRSSYKRLSIKRGIYEQWPTQEKPSLVNCSTSYLKYLNNKKNQQEKQNHQKRPKSSAGFKKMPATFSTCTTMEFYSSSQNNLHLLSKFTSTPTSQKSDQQIHLGHKPKFSPYMTPQSDESQMRHQDDSNLQQQNEGSYDTEMNSKYESRPRTVERKSANLQKRSIKTAKIDRQKIDIQDSDGESINTRKQSIARHTTGHYSRPTTAKTALSNEKNQQFVKTPLNLKTVNTTQNNFQQNIQSFYNCPLRLKDYQTNFQAFKVISELIDHQMKWQPKKKRPKSSVLFRKYQLGLKA